jgi:hypothetical protein
LVRVNMGCCMGIGVESCHYISDFGILAVPFTKTGGGPVYNARANFDRNGIMNISDFGLLAVNDTETSPIDVSG